MSTKIAAAYLRKSVVKGDRPGDASREAQTQAVQAMCGPNVVLYDADWGVSGTKTDRKDYQRLRADIAAGKVESVCAYSLSRFARSTKELISFVELCHDHGVAFRTRVENIDTSTAMGVMLFHVMAAFAQFEADVARERTLAGMEAQRAKGHVLERPSLGYKADKDSAGLRVLVPDGSADVVIRAYEKARTAEGAARLLTEEKAITPREARRVRQAEERGETYVPVPQVWSTSVVAQTIQRHRPDLLPPVVSRAAKQRHGSGLYSRLVACPDCGTTLTPNIRRNQAYCHRARRTPHTRSTVAFSKLRPFFESESAKYLPAGIVTKADDQTKERDALLAKKARIGEVYGDGGMTSEVYRTKVAALDAELAKIASTERAIASITPEPVAIDWASQSEDEIGDTLRVIWNAVTLDPATWLPAKVEWRVPAEFYDPAARDALTERLDREAQKADA